MSINLSAYIDPSYKIFNDRILNDQIRPTLGVRLSVLRPLAHRLARSDYKTFLATSALNEPLNIPSPIPTTLTRKKMDTAMISAQPIFLAPAAHEEILLAGMVISLAPMDFATRVRYLKLYAPHMTNWALVDCFVNRTMFKKNESDQFFSQEWLPLLQSAHSWTVRLGLIIAMTYFLTPDKIDTVLSHLRAIHTAEYYINMAAAWLLAESWIKQHDAIQNYLLQHHSSFSPVILKMMVGKMRDSHRIARSDVTLARTWLV